MGSSVFPDTRWAVSSDAYFEWTPGGLLAKTAHHRAGTLIDTELVPLLDAFAKAMTVDEGVATFLSRYAAKDGHPELADQAGALARQLCRTGVLRDDATPTPLRSGNYAHPSPHVLMLFDYGRTAAFRQAIMRNVQGKVVAEIGCGSGILACFAVLAGAKHVYAIEQTEIILIAQEIAERNGLADRISFVPGNSQQVELDQRVDLVYSELIGTDALGEGALAPLIDARKRLLKPGGMMIPWDLSIWTVGVHSPQFARYEDAITQKVRSAQMLSEIYALDLAPLADAYIADLARTRETMTYEAWVADFVGASIPSHGEKILTDEMCIATYDFSGDLRERQAVPTVRLTATSAGSHNGMLTYFKTKLDEHTLLTTSPFSGQHAVNWRQVVSRLPELSVDVGHEIALEVSIDPARQPSVWYSRT